MKQAMTIMQRNPYQLAAVQSRKLQRQFTALFLLIMSMTYSSLQITDSCSMIWSSQTRTSSK